jgi:hypothetical protein
MKVKTTVHIYYCKFDWDTKAILKFSVLKLMMTITEPM